MNKQTGSIFTLSRAASSLAYMFRWNIPGTISICSSLMAGEPLLWSEGCWFDQQPTCFWAAVPNATISADAPAACKCGALPNVLWWSEFLIFNLSHFLLDFGGRRWEQDKDLTTWGGFNRLGFKAEQRTHPASAYRRAETLWPQQHASEQPFVINAVLLDEAVHGLKSPHWLLLSGSRGGCT